MDFRLGLLLVLLLLVERSFQAIRIGKVAPNVSPLSGGVEILITGTEFNDTVTAEFSVNQGQPVFPTNFVMNPDGTRTATFLAPPSLVTLSSFGSWVRLIDTFEFSSPVSFYWEDPITITSVVVTQDGSRDKYQVLGSGFVDGIQCATPLHTPVKAKVKSSSSLNCNFNHKEGVVYQLILIQLSGRTVTYTLVSTTGSTGTTGTTGSRTTGTTGVPATSGTTGVPATSGTTGTTGVALEPYFGSATYVYAWCGAVDRVSPDYVAIIDAVPTSPTYQKLVAKAELPADLAFNNEPHHMQFVNNNTVLVAGGLLSLLTRPQELFFWDVRDPLKPIYLKAENPQTSVIDDILALPEGGFLVSIMGAADGTSPGTVGEWDANLRYVGEWPLPSERPSDMNPHGISLNQEFDILMTTDFVDPASTLMGSPGVVFRDSVRIWNPWSKRKISSTVRIPKGKGLMDVKFLPHNKDALAYTTNIDAQDGLILYAINGKTSEFQAVFNLSKYFAFSLRDYMLQTPTQDGKKYLITNSYTGLLIMMDTTDPYHPLYSDSVVFGIQSGIHAVELSDDDRFAMVSGYFLNEDNLGMVHEDGDRSVHIAEIADNDVRRTNFNVNMNTAGPYPMRPHMIRFYNTKSTHRPL